MKIWLQLGSHSLVAIAFSLLGALHTTHGLPSLKQQYSDDLAMSIHLLFDEDGEARSQTELQSRISSHIVNMLLLSASSSAKSDAENERLAAISKRVLAQDLLRYMERDDVRRNAVLVAGNMAAD
ncbi:hypothetical protein [Stenotrophomonas maltophilia]|uniref:hypothetical protein n=1 Tax=Stenotrophomonas maltophilia TaxID=40324 RepID=UPI000C26121E|nr:hypothetical protein [Stenotrophomonas maltophilia]PJL44045.1 hypothetical protein B9Y56_04915 [Stenotrophomonas maltophilia]BBO50693.1 hypothetical protein KMM349_10240 [Stenotrophomonas maltophilia]